MRESDLQPPKPLWHEDTRGRPGGHNHHHSGRGSRGGNGNAVGPLSSAAHRMLNHTLQARAPGQLVVLLCCAGGCTRPYAGSDAGDGINCLL